MGTARRDSSIPTVPCAPQGPAANIPSLVPPDIHVPHCNRGDTRGQGTVPTGPGTHGISLTPILPQGPGSPGPLRHLRPLCPGVVLWAHAGDSRESGVVPWVAPGAQRLGLCPLLPLPCPQQVIKKTRFPHWDEVLEFELAQDEPGDSMLSVEVWDWDIVGKNDFLGQVRAGHMWGWLMLCAPQLTPCLCTPGKGPSGCTGSHRGLVPAPALPQQHQGARVSVGQWRMESDRTRGRVQPCLPITLSL